MTQDENNKSAETQEKIKEKKFHLNIKSAITSAANTLGIGKAKEPTEGDLSDSKRSTVATPSQAKRYVPPLDESHVGDSLDTSKMPKPKPPSVNYKAYESLYGKEDEGYESSAEREFEKSYVGNADITIQELLHEYTQKLWVRLALGAFLMLLVIFIIYQLYLNFYTSIKTETAGITIYSETIDVEGIAIRDELVIGGSVNGSAVNAAKNGEKVLKGQAVINIFNSGKAAAAYERIEEIDKQIYELESMVTASEDSANAVTNIEKLIDEQMILLSDDTYNNDLSNLSEIKGEISYLLNKRLVAMRKVENYQDRIDELNREKASLEAAYSQQPSTVNAPSSGYYVGSLDGYETLLDTSMLGTLTADELQSIMSRKVSVPENSTGKLIKDFTWYLACPVPAKDAEDYLAVKSVYTLILPYSKTGSMQGTLVSLNEGDGNTWLAIFECSSLLSELCEMRSQPVKIQIRSYRGFNIKKSALHVTINEVEEKDDDGNVVNRYEERYSCVYTVVGNQLVAKKIDILYNGDKFVICSAGSENGSNYLSLYDEVVTEGKGLYAGKIIN